jgi:hypothetical protein
MIATTADRPVAGIGVPGSAPCELTRFVMSSRRLRAFLVRAAWTISEHDRDIADDMIQEALITLAYLDLSRFTDEDMSYLCQKLANVMLDFRRAEDRHGFTGRAPRNPRPAWRARRRRGADLL